MLTAQPKSRLLWCVGLSALALPALALAQQSLLPPGFNEIAPPPEQTQPTTNGQAPDSSAREAAEGAPSRAGPAESSGVVESDTLTPEELADVPQPPPPVELPPGSKRDPRVIGAIDPVQWGFGEQPWGTANGTFLSVLMRKLDTPLPSRWLHITLRNALLSRSPAPPQVNPADWVAERAWLLLRMGEADAAAMLVQGVDVDDYTPKLTQVAVQAALATADASALCPLRERMSKVEARVLPLVQAMCAALNGEATNAASQIEQARRRGRIGGIDLILADKVVGAGADTGRAATLEWDGVDGLTSWRFGLATATGVTPPDRLMNISPMRVRAWQARAPLLSAEQRLPSARIATGLGVFSSAALGDLYSTIYDGTDPSDLSGTDAWQLRLAFTGRDADQKLGAMRRLWGDGKDPVQAAASHALLSLAACQVRPDAALGNDVPRLIASMLAGGYDRNAGRWASAVAQLDNEAADRSWALLAVGTNANVDVGNGRITDFIDRDSSPDKARSGLLVAALAGTGRIGLELAAQLDDRFELGLGRVNSWTAIAKQAAAKKQPGSAVLIAAVGMQGNRPDRIPAAQVYRALAAMRASGLDYSARMIAADLLARS